MDTLPTLFRAINLCLIFIVLCASGCATKKHANDISLLNVKHAAEVNDLNEAAKHYKFEIDSMKDRLNNVTALNEQMKLDATIKVLILGNSITYSTPLPGAGWLNTCGMAASSPENDFVHVLTRKLKEKAKNELIVNAWNIANWETKFTYSDFGNSYVGSAPDLLIVRVGENVPEGDVRYAEELDAMIKKFNARKVFVTGNFWVSKFKDNVQRTVAKENGYVFVDLSKLSADGKNMALAEFSHPAVRSHPSDRGMLAIADSLYSAIDRTLVLIK